MDASSFFAGITLGILVGALGVALYTLAWEAFT